MYVHTELVMRLLTSRVRAPYRSLAGKEIGEREGGEERKGGIASFLALENL